MILNEEIKNTNSVKIKGSIKDFLVEFLDKSQNPLIVYCFDNCKACDSIIGDYLTSHFECTIKTSKDIIDSLNANIKKSIILDVGIIPFHLLVYDAELGYFLVYRNKAIGAYFEENDDLKPMVMGIADKVERINRMKN